MHRTGHVTGPVRSAWALRWTGLALRRPPVAGGCGPKGGVQGPWGRLGWGGSRRAARQAGLWAQSSDGVGGWGPGPHVGCTPPPLCNGGVLRAVPALCARCAQSWYRTMPNLHSSA